MVKHAITTTAINMKYAMSILEKHNKIIYIVLLGLISLVSVLSLIPSLKPYTGFLTPPVVLFVGLVYALLCGQPYQKFNKSASKKLLQYSVVGLGFGMNLHQSLASGKEGMMFTVISVVGTMLIGMFIGCKLLKMDRDTSYLISSAPSIRPILEI